MKHEGMRAGLVIVLLALGAIVIGSFAKTYGAAAGRDEAVQVGPAPPCPIAFVDHIGSTARIRERLTRVPEGRALLNALTIEVRFCFGEIDVPVVSEERLLLLDRRVDIDEQAARAGHLIDHLTHGMPFPDEVSADTDCDAVVARAIVSEARAYAVEVRLRRELGVEGARYEFEQTFWSTAESEREALIGRYLREHPQGAPNMDGLVAGYQLRCEVERSEAAQ